MKSEEAYPSGEAQMDRESRYKINHVMDRNFFVEASAGSGKTTALVDRMVAMVESGFDRPDGIQIEEITAITFTRTAASEFQTRFQTRLDERRRKATDPERIRKYEEALNKLGRCFMGTIDSYCNQLISEHPVEAGVPVNVSISEAPELTEAYRHEWQEMLLGEYGQDVLDLYNMMLNWNIRTDILRDEVLLPFANKREMKTVYDRYPRRDYVAWFPDTQEPVQTLLWIIHENHLVKDNKTHKELWQDIWLHKNSLMSDWVENPGDIYNALKPVSGTAVLRLVANPCDFTKPGDPDFSKYVEKSRRDFVISFSDIVNELEEDRYSLVMTFLTDFCCQAAKKLRHAGILSFADNLIYLRNMLKTDAEKGGKLIRYIAARKKYYLVDEFQDTNPLQAQILFYLTAETPVADWQKCRPRPGSLFIVGDPKQSIYRFSQADIASYQDVKQLFEQTGGEILTLYHNFRSRAILRSWFDSVFVRMMPGDNEYQPQYHPIASREEPDGDDVLEGVYKYYDIDETGRNKTEVLREKDTANVCTLIGNLCENPYYKIFDQTKRATRKIEYRDIMVITRGKKRMNEYMLAMQKNNIPFVVSGKTVFDQCELLRTLILLVKAVSNPYDALSVTAALKSSAYSISDKALYAYVKSGGSIRLYEKERIQSTDVAAALDELSAFQSFASSNSVIASVCHIAETSEILPVHLISSREKVDYFYYAIELLRQAQQSGKIYTLSDAATFLENLLNNETERELLLELAPNAVTIINLHKSKGLQSPVVILADPIVKRFAPRETSIRDGSDVTRYVFSISGSDSNNIIARTNNYTAHMTYEVNHYLAENNRLLYVAATRAENLLFVASQEDENSEKNAWKELLVDISTDADYFLQPNEKYLCPVPDPLKIERCTIQDQIEKAGDDLIQASVPTYVSILPSERMVASVAASSDALSLQEEKTEASTVDIVSDEKKETNKTDAVLAMTFIEESTPLVPTSGRDWNASLMGTLAHKLMEILVKRQKSGNPVKSDPATLTSLAKNIVSAYECEQKHIETYENALTGIAQKMLSDGYPQINVGNNDNGRSSPIPENILLELSEAEQVYCEVPFQLVIDPEDLNCKDLQNTSSSPSVQMLISGTMDLIYLKDDRWQIVDYKTNFEATELDQKYVGQLEAYQSAFKQIMKEDARVGIYHIEINDKQILHK